ncbi:MAG TPA: hypothetical protein V6D11_27205 [Waterburya sp.]|jgi:hypothetical protein
MNPPRQHRSACLKEAIAHSTVKDVVKILGSNGTKVAFLAELI